MEGDTISVNCSYDPRQWWREKSWCRQLDESRCQHVVSAPTLWLPFSRSRRGTTSIRDNARAGLLTVTMRRLQKEDAGLYQCRTDFLGETRSLRKVQLEVLAGMSWGSELEGSYWNFMGSFLEFHGFLLEFQRFLLEFHGCLQLPRAHLSQYLLLSHSKEVLCFTASFHS